MKLRRAREVVLPGTVGQARVDRRTIDLAKRLRPGEVAVIDQVDIDRASADALVACGAAAVVNAQPSTSGRFPNLGPEILLAAGIPLLDSVGDTVFGQVREGDVVRVHGDTLFAGDRPLAAGVAQDAASVAVSMSRARAGLAVQLEAFAANTMEHLLAERELIFDGAGFPGVSTALKDRPAVVVARGYDYEEDLRLLRPYIREHSPVLIGVDGGADALREAGLVPDLIVGDMAEVSDAALRCGAEVVVHAHADGRTPGLARVQDLGVEALVFPSAGTSEDVALLLADQAGAELLVTVGTHTTLLEFLDKGRQGMASTFVTRLRVGEKLVDAKAVSLLHRNRIPGWDLLALVLAALVAMVAALYVAAGGPAFGALVTQAWAAIEAAVSGLT